MLFVAGFVVAGFVVDDAAGFFFNGGLIEDGFFFFDGAVGVFGESVFFEAAFFFEGGVFEAGIFLDVEAGPRCEEGLFFEEGLDFEEGCFFEERRLFEEGFFFFDMPELRFTCRTPTATGEMDLRSITRGGGWSCYTPAANLVNFFRG